MGPLCAILLCRSSIPFIGIVDRIFLGFTMPSETIYRLRDGVQVRREKFGLLFYNYRGPRLYFVPTEDLLDPDFFTSCRKAGELVDSIEATNAWPRSWIESWVNRVMIMLEQKGLIYGQSIC